MTDDRAASQPTDTNLPVGAGGDGVRDVPSQSDVRPPRQRNLLASFRATGLGIRPVDLAEPAFPAVALPAHSPDRGTSGGPLQPASGGPDPAPATPASPDDPARRSAAVLAAGPVAAPLGPAVAAAESSSGRRVRGRVGRAAGGGAASGKKQAAASAKPAFPREIAKLVDKSAPAAAVPATSRITPTESAAADARRLFREIGERFNENRRASKTRAYAAYRHDLMANLDVLIMGGAIDLKEVTTVITNLELLTKETEAEATETPATVLGRWLRMGPEEVRGLEEAGQSEAEVVDDITELDEPDDSSESVRESETEPAE